MTRIKTRRKKQHTVKTLTPLDFDRARILASQALFVRNAGLAVGIYLSTRQTVLGLEKVIAFSPMICGIGLIAFALSHILWFSLLMSLLIGLSTTLQIASSNTVIQTIVEDDKRGRVMSLFMMSFLGMAPFGNLLAGSLAEEIGTPNTLIIGGIFCILGSLFFAKQLPALRRLV